MVRMAKIMQYNLMTTDKDGKMPLAMEVEHIDNKIHFYQDRFKDSAFIVFDHPHIPEQLRIPPMLLVTLVENAFKHGEFTKRDKPIRIILQINGNNILFTVSNWKRTGCPDKTTSVGLVNLNKRLRMSYSRKNYDLITTQDAETYFTELSITL
jgi:two-component system, LytTR family, sensor kinase